MISTTKQHLHRNFKKIGPLTDAQFLATKALSKRMIYAREVDLRNIIAIGVDGREYRLSAIEAVSEYQNGNVNTLKLKATVRGMAGGAEQSGNVKLENITDIEFDSAIGFLVVENEQCVFTNIPCWTEMKDLTEVMRDKSNWVNSKSLGELLPPDTLLSDFIEVRDSIERDLDRDVKLDIIENPFDIRQFD